MEDIKVETAIKNGDFLSARKLLKSVSEFAFQLTRQEKMFALRLRDRGHTPFAFSARVPVIIQLVTLYDKARILYELRTFKVLLK